VVALDVTKPHSIAAALEASGFVDVVVNNAGIGVVGAFEASRPVGRLTAKDEGQQKQVDALKAPVSVSHADAEICRCSRFHLAILSVSDAQDDRPPRKSDR
jgi:NAD(P)-dependent dehydrogenase (short-subunit alcohol dehydrogenase family)